MVKLYKIQFAVSTCREFMDITLPPLIKSFDDAGIIRDTIHVFVNNSNSEILDDVIDGIHYHYNAGLTYFEWVSIKLILERNIPGAWWFFIHDTCTLGNGCYNKIYAKVTQTEKLAIRLTGIGIYGACNNNMGAIHSTGLQEFKLPLQTYIGELSGIHDISERKTNTIRTENWHFGTIGHDIFQDTAQETSVVTIYGGTRWCEYYSGVDIYKYKRNYMGPENVTTFL